MLKNGWCAACAMLSPLTVGIALFVAGTRTLSSYALFAPLTNLAMLMWHIYGGLDWDFAISIQNIIAWVLIMLPAILGPAKYFSLELGNHLYLNLHRFSSYYRWWTVQTIGLLLHAMLICVIYTVTTLVVGWLFGLRGFILTYPDTDGFWQTSSYLWLLAPICTGMQMLLFSLLFSVCYLMIRDYRVAVFASIAPIVLGLLSYSNDEKAESVNGFINWAMPKRFNIFLPYGVWPAEGLIKFSFLVLLISALGIGVAKAAKPVSRKLH